MAGEWIKMECATPDKPEVLALTVKMGWDDPDLTVGKLFRLWRWFDQQTVDGNAHGVTAALLDKLIGVTGFVQAVADVGWLHITPDGLSLSNFDNHNGATAKSRAMTAKRVGKHRSNGEGNADSNAASVTGALAREEKRREDQETSNLPVAPARLPAEQPQLSLVEGANPKAWEPPACPHLKLLALWTEVLPAMPQHLPAQWKGTRADHLRTRWRETAEQERWPDELTGLRYFRNLFAYIRKSAFLTGKAKTVGDKRPFVIELEWLVNPTNWAKVIEGKYHQDAA